MSGSQKKANSAPQPGEGQEAQRNLTPEARRALAEAERRRASQDKRGAVPPEVGGRDGPDPARYGDWEKGGLISDF